MSKTKKEPIENAVEIIEKFGGIRPMSSKINVAVTTVQGWKKRNVIPGTRKDTIIQAAKEYDIDLTDYISDAPVIEQDNDVKDEEAVVPRIDPEEGTSEEAETKPEAESEKDAQSAGGPDAEQGSSSSVQDHSAKEETAAPVSPANKKEPDVVKEAQAATAQASGSNADFTEIAVETERRAVTKSTVITAVIILLIIGAIVALLWPNVQEYDQRGQRLDNLEGEVSTLKEEQSAFKGLVPENWSEQLETLKQQAQTAQKTVNDTVSQIKTESEALMNSDINTRVEKLQTYVSEIAGENGYYALMNRFEQMRNSMNGQEALNNAVMQLANIYQSDAAKTEETGRINALLDAARQKNESLQQTLGDVPQSELKAAAMLLAMSQVRSSLNRKEAAFDDDLELLMNMVGEDNTELRTALEKLAPHAKAGVLTPGGLKEEFQTAAGDAVAASLRGENVSFSEKMSARMNDILKIEKDGELVTGTDTQVKINKAEKLVEKGQIQQAVTYLKSALDAKELDPLRPWIDKAEAALTASKVERMITQAIELNTGRGLLGGSELLNEAQR